MYDWQREKDRERLSERNRKRTGERERESLRSALPKTVDKSPPSLQHFGPRGTVGFGYEKSLVVASLMKGILEPMYRCGSTWG